MLKDEPESSADSGFDRSKKCRPDPFFIVDIGSKIYSSGGLF
jgi:hypothetical protein